MSFVVNNSFLSLETTDGDFIIAGTSMTKLPPKIKLITGKVVIGSNPPDSLVGACNLAVIDGIIQGGAYIL